MSSTDVFFGEKNEAMLQRVLYNDICRRTGNDLNERQASRLIKTVKHYMGEIHRVQGGQPVPELNKEVLRIVLPDFILYLDRKQRDDRSVVSDIEVGPGLGPGLEAPVPEDRRIQDIGTAFTKLQNSRQENRSKPPVQDFRLSLQDEPAVSMDVFERMKSDREAEAARTVQQLSITQTQTYSKGPGQAQGQAAFANTLDVYSKSNRRAAEEAESAFAEAERRRLESRANASNVFTNAPPPDMRALILGDKTNLDRRMNESAGNPTLVRDSRTTSQQMLIVHEPDTMAYKETELNLFVYSGDRDWISPSSGTETRYNFTVNFDPSNLPTGLRLNPTSTVKFRNIVRVEFIKAIMPGEGLDMIVSKGSTSTYDSSVNVNILSFPYIQVRIPELDTNNYGTNQGLNSAFSILQYDGNWISDTSIATQRGYLAMIPKFMKCQKAYTTPLATIQKLSFRFERPDGTLLSTAADTLDIAQVFPSFAMTTGVFSAGAFTNTYYSKDVAVDLSGSSYYWLKTSKYFNHWNVTKGDKIVVKNLQWGVTMTGAGAAQQTDFLSYLQQDSGLLVVDTGVITGTALGNYVFSSGGTNSYNSQGYANAILVRGKFADPTTGVFTPSALGGVSDDYSNTAYLSYFLTNNVLTSGRLINLNHQVQVALRVITRELDSTGILRPDNL